ncbi:ABC transporter permease [Labrys wisconsinensis]|uniref:Simple sugar transport system permease protein n=1 Tax=Labrys wisconsinensis TaxID=425677 RepID=A0ABU0JGE9_9HYPH|nr:ABC transporter permease [Labrys wisconsinensis]MDQ0472202.1 simple sugar transport system permease protein [Labrys wisconsinensis]
MTAYTERQQGSRLRDFFQTHAHVLSIAVFLIACCALFTALNDVFLSTGNLLNLLRQAAPTLIVAVAMTFVITTGGIDLSVGSIIALVNAAAALLLRAGWDWPLVCVLMLALGAAIGLFQGFFIAYQKIPAFIVTLAGLSAIRGVALVLTGGFSILIPPSLFLSIGRGTLFGIPNPAILGLAVAVIGYVVLNTTLYGRRVCAVGANAEAARRVGMPAQRVVASVYVWSGVASALAALVVAARLGSGSSNAAVGTELDVIAAVVLGGTSLAGGRGTIVGTVLGALTISVISNGLILAHIDAFFTQIVTGAIILTAIWLNTRIFDHVGTVRRRS